MLKKRKNACLTPRLSHPALRRLMCEIGRRIWTRGLCAGNDGNHTVRISPDRILCTPTLVSKGDMHPEDLCIVDMEGNQVAGKSRRTSEIFLHLAIYHARPDITCTIHNHPPHATAFALSGLDVPTGLYPEVETLLGKVHTAPYVLPGDQRLGQSILPYVQNANTILLQNHGVICFDTDLETCYQKLEVVDQYCKILLALKTIGSIHPLTPAQMAELFALKSRLKLSDPRMAKPWQPESNAFLKELRRVAD